LFIGLLHFWQWNGTAPVAEAAVSAAVDLPLAIGAALHRGGLRVVLSVWGHDQESKIITRLVENPSALSIVPLIGAVL
jgi:hypothetical protein